MSALGVWSTDIKAAPPGRYVIKQRKEGVDTRVFVPEWVILTTKCGKVTRSHYQPEVKRWLMLADGEQPLAWMPWPEPYSHSAARNGANTENDHVDGGASARTEASEDVVALTGQIESPIKAEMIDGNVSLAARESEKPLHSNPHLPSGAAAHSADSPEDSSSRLPGTNSPAMASGRLSVATSSEPRGMEDAGGDSTERRAPHSNAGV